MRVRTSVKEETGEHGVQLVADSTKLQQNSSSSSAFGFSFLFSNNHIFNDAGVYSGNL